MAKRDDGPLTIERAIALLSEDNPRAGAGAPELHGSRPSSDSIATSTARPRVTPRRAATSARRAEVPRSTRTRRSSPRGPRWASGGVLPLRRRAAMVL